MTCNTRTDANAAPFTGRHMLACMLAFFGVIIAVNFTMAWMAGQTWTGLVVKNSYVASQKFNAGLDQARAQAQRGWTSRLEYVGGVLNFELQDTLKRPVVLSDVVIAIGRPAFEQEDRAHVLHHVGRGRYQVRDILAPGAWAVQIRGMSAEGPYRRDSRLFVAPEAVSEDG